MKKEEEKKEKDLKAKEKTEAKKEEQDAKKAEAKKEATMKKEEEKKQAAIKKQEEKKRKWQTLLSKCGKSGFWERTASTLLRKPLVTRSTAPLTSSA